MNRPRHLAGQKVEAAPDIYTDASSLSNPGAVNLCPDTGPDQAQTSLQIFGQLVLNVTQELWCC